MDASLPGADLASGVRLYHDAPGSGIIAAGIGDRGDAGLQITLAHFGGTFVSIACDLSDEACALATRHRLFEATVLFAVEPDCSAWLRLNLLHGPNDFRPISRLDAGPGQASAVIDLAAGLDRTGVSKGWVELIFDLTGAARVTVQDVLCRLLPRAEI